LLRSFGDEECKAAAQAIVLRKCLNTQELEWFGKVSDQFEAGEGKARGDKEPPSPALWVVRAAHKQRPGGAATQRTVGLGNWSQEVASYTLRV
jgi:hypothetical protein